MSHNISHDSGNTSRDGCLDVESCSDFDSSFDAISQRSISMSDTVYKMNGPNQAGDELEGGLDEFGIISRSSTNSRSSTDFEDVDYDAVVQRNKLIDEFNSQVKNIKEFLDGSKVCDGSENQIIMNVFREMGRKLGLLCGDDCQKLEEKYELLEIVNEQERGKSRVLEQRVWKAERQNEETLACLEIQRTSSKQLQEEHDIQRADSEKWRHISSEFEERTRKAEKQNEEALSKLEAQIIKSENLQEECESLGKANKQHQDLSFLLKQSVQEAQKRNDRVVGQLEIQKRSFERDLASNFSICDNYQSQIRADLESIKKKNKALEYDKEKGEEQIKNLVDKLEKSRSLFTGSSRVWVEQRENLTDELHYSRDYWTILQKRPCEPWEQQQDDDINTIARLVKYLEDEKQDMKEFVNKYKELGKLAAEIVDRVEFAREKLREEVGSGNASLREQNAAWEARLKNVKEEHDAYVKKLTYEHYQSSLDYQRQLHSVFEWIENELESCRDMVTKDLKKYHQFDGPKGKDGDPFEVTFKSYLQRSENNPSERSESGK
ncbi:hypothetical protein B0O99DRAFT_702617 [Bisporella sp. PMI_857]|nr:hypothetical protein B0O99DRAFT_702617 [Bisporella sp. PMI_857]